MKIQCHLCREFVPIGRFEVSGPGIEVTCTACAGRFRVAAATGEIASETPPVETAARREPGPDEMRCPKCARLQPGAEACRHCGLRAERFADYAAADDDEIPEEIAGYWQHCRDRWDEDEPHERFVEAVSRIEAFAYAARRYREVLDERPGDPRARRQLQRVSRMAEAVLVSVAVVKAKADSGGEPEPYRNVVIMLIGLLLVAGLVGIYVLFKGVSAEDPPTRVDPPTYKPSPRR